MGAGKGGNELKQIGKAGGTETRIRRSCRGDPEVLGERAGRWGRSGKQGTGEGGVIHRGCQ